MLKVIPEIDAYFEELEKQGADTKKVIYSLKQGTLIIKGGAVC